MFNIMASFSTTSLSSEYANPTSPPSEENSDEVSRLFIDDDDGDEWIKDVNLAAVNVDTSEEEFQKQVKLLNVEQKAIFDMVHSHIQTSLDQKTETQMRVFITGGAGTGKTFLLKLIQQLIIRMYGRRQAVKIGAFTGAAAKLVGGKTLHSLFRIPINEKNPMHVDTYQMDEHLIDEWLHTEFVIIDEISMVSYEMLNSIHLRLQLLKEKYKQLFGGLNIIVFGDLFQLNPIKGSLIYNQKPIMRKQKKIFLWRMFRFIELKMNMRQKNDQDFIRLLNNARFGRLTARDVRLLRSRLRSSKGVDEFDNNNKESIRVVPTNKEARTYNEYKLNQLIEETGVQVFEIEAKDTVLKPNDVKLKPFVIPDNEFLTGGFLKIVKLAEGAKVMLRVNVNVDIGLVNGSIGIILKINFSKDESGEHGDLPHSVVVDFGSTGVHCISPKSVVFDAPQPHVQIERTQIPLIFAWAVTSHKLQGATIDSAVISLGHSTFAAGQPYVMLSRCRTLDGLIFNQLYVDKIKRLVNRSAIKEMKRLRKTVQR